jgi:hypothetical protein
MALEGIRAQATQLDLTVATDCAGFGHGFDGQTFDRILFYEAFHHAIEFDDLLLRLHGRLNPGGKVILCGEPIVAAPCDAVPYPWGPRLDARFFPRFSDEHHTGNRMGGTASSVPEMPAGRAVCT